jgi:hypothetical protein
LQGYYILLPLTLTLTRREERGFIVFFLHMRRWWIVNYSLAPPGERVAVRGHEKSFCMSN